MSVALGLEPDEDGEGPQSLQGQVLGAMREMQRFMKQLRGI